MARLLDGRLPLAMGKEVTGDIYNRTVRILELNLGRFDPNSTPSFIVSTRDELKFNAGDVIWNLDEVFCRYGLETLGKIFLPLIQQA